MGDQGDTARTAEGTTRFRIFVNYRRTDSAGHAGRLYDALADRFGEDAVFMDVDTIEPGTDFAEVIDKAMDASDVVLAVIGPYWLVDTGGRRRIDAVDDFVRMELESALERGVRIIPLLVNAAEMLRPSELPASLVKLAGRQALRLRDDRWRADVARLMTSLEMLERERELRRAGEFDAATEQRGRREELVREQADQARRRPAPPAQTERPRTRDAEVIPEHRLQHTRIHQSIGAPASLLAAEVNRVRIAGLAGILGACLVLGSLPGKRLPDLANQARVGYWLPVAVGAVAVIVLVASAIRSSRPNGFAAAGALGFALLGVTLPLAWHEGNTTAFPHAVRFGLGVAGSALAALGAAYATWSLLAGMPEARRSHVVPRSRNKWFGAAVLGAAVVVASLFVLPEWTWHLSAKTTSQNWSSGIHRYVSGTILITVVVIGLGLSGVISERRRRLVLASLLACLLVGESVPLIFTPPSPVWGPGRWLRILGALVCAVGLAQAAAASEGQNRAAGVVSAQRSVR